MPRPFHLLSSKARGRALRTIVKRGGFGFFDGGCLVFARAFCSMFPGAEVVTILRGGSADHYGVAIPGMDFLPGGGGSGTTGYGDFLGFFPEPGQWVEHFRQNELVNGELQFCPSFVPSPEIPDDPTLTSAVALALRN